MNATDSIPIQSEIEATFLDIDKPTLRQKIQSLGGKLLQPETLMRRTIFDSGTHSFVRVRDEGNCITMTYKYFADISLSGAKEINLIVNNYNNAVNLVKACGLQIKAHQETLREEWQLDDVELDIDTWPGLPTYVEIEGPSEASVKTAAAKLGFDYKDAQVGAVDQIYHFYYGVSQDEVNNCAEIVFEKLPVFLEGKARLH